jgi:hypothetical protein
MKSIDLTISEKELPLMLNARELLVQLRNCAEYFEKENSAFGVRMAKNLRSSIAKAEGKSEVL